MGYQPVEFVAQCRLWSRAFVFDCESVYVIWGNRWVVVCLWAMLILAGTSVPSLGRLRLGEHGSDKLVHFCAYLVLGYLVYRAVGSPGTAGGRRTLLGLALCATWAIADEAHQAFVPLRSPEVTDFLADLTGSATGIALRHFRHRTEERLAKGDKNTNDA